MNSFSLVIIFLILSTQSYAQMNHAMDSQPMSPSECSGMNIWDYETANCAPIAMAGMPMKNWMIHGNAFLVQTSEGGARGRDQFSVPNMIMGDFGSSAGDINYFNVDIMLTFEKWTFPDRGYPELLQIGERDKFGNSYIDAQHPHSSPLMGLTFSDTISLGGRDHFKIYFSPRGQTTEGPIAFMHRATGMINPDAPLGHHIGQDSNHISSTVIGMVLNINKATLESSVYNATEPEPRKSDLPLGNINSHAYRFIYEFTDNFYAMASASFARNPESNEPDIDRVNRYSSSLYYEKKFANGFMFHNTFIFGIINFFDHFSKLRSFGEELLFHSVDNPHNFWGRWEVLERGGSELMIKDMNDPRWVSALTVGYTFDLLKNEFGKVGMGASVTKDFLATKFNPAYGNDPLSGKIFVQLSGMKMSVAGM
jgi:hypothetical protein